jgi:predicted amidohydrolase
MLAIDAGGARIAYRKRCPGPEESPHFAPGDDFGFLTVDGWRLGLSICRDTGIVEHVRGTVAQGIDLFVAGILDAAEDLPRHHARYRAIAAEHGLWVAIASFAGATGEGYAHAMGGSGIWAPGGDLVAVAGTATGDIARAALVTQLPVVR